MKTAEQLKPCPFCGKTPVFLQYGNDTLKLKCECGIERTQKILRFSLEWLTKEMISKWNSRYRETTGSIC